MKISVVMTSYNGENFIYEQLQSIYGQTLQPDEVIIFDDCSTDKTVSIVKSFITKHNLENWRLTVNPENKGWMYNFLEALKEAHGDFIFFSDQDDIWYLDKIEVMSRLMEQYPIFCLNGKVTTIDSNGTIFEPKNKISTENNLGNLVKYNFSAKFNTAILPGCSMCIKKTIADIITQIDIKNCPYDEQCCRLGILLNGTYTLDKPVIYHRIHEHNTSNFMSGISFGSSNLQKRIDSIENNIVWLESLLTSSRFQKFLSPKRNFFIKNTILFQKERLKFLKGKNILQFIRLFKFKKYYSGMPMYLGDFCYAFQINKLTGTILWHVKLWKTCLLNYLTKKRTKQ